MRDLVSSHTFVSDDEGIGVIALHVCECVVDVSVMSLIGHLCEESDRWMDKGVRSYMLERVREMSSRLTMHLRVSTHFALLGSL
jgi:hypothetical protein